MIPTAPEKSSPKNSTAPCPTNTDSKSQAVRESDWAYLAGFVDGEGSLRIGTPQSHDTSLRISQKYRSVLDYLQGKFGGRVDLGGLAFNLRWSHRNQLVPLLAKLIPHLRVKRRQANLVYAFLLGLQAGRRPTVACREWLNARMTAEKHNGLL